MFPLVTLGTKYLYFLGSILLAGVISTGSGNTTGVNGGAIMVPNFTTAGIASKSQKVVIREPFVAFVRAATGSTTKAYPASCFRNPLRGMNLGSGSLAWLTLHNIANPTGVGGDIGFVKGCGDEYGSGATLIDNTCTATGCTSKYRAGTADWNGADYVKFTPRAALAPGYIGRITGEVEDNLGE
jgi:hypothetical protein